MITINLLPDSMRKREGLPRGQLLGLVLAILALLGLGYVIMSYHMFTIPDLEREREALNQRKRNLELVVAELREINNEIDRMSGYVDAVKGLYKRRVPWAKILSDIKNIVNFDSTMSEYNSDQRYLWFTSLQGKEKSLSVNGFATASSQVVAMQMPERLIQRFLDYSPVSLPEKDEEERLQNELRVAVSEHDNERRERPELPIQGPRELAIRRRLEEIKNVKSGGIALTPFFQLLEPGSLQLKDASWGNAPRPKGVDAGDATFPMNAWSFGLVMNLK